MSHALGQVFCSTWRGVLPWLLKEALPLAPLQTGYDMSDNLAFGETWFRDTLVAQIRFEVWRYCHFRDVLEGFWRLGNSVSREESGGSRMGARAVRGEREKARARNSWKRLRDPETWDMAPAAPT